MGVDECVHVDMGVYVWVCGHTYVCGWVYMWGCVWGGDREMLFSISEETWTEVGGRRGNKKSGVAENKGQHGGED